AESAVAAGGLRTVGTARRDTITVAVRVVAKKRTTAHDPATADRGPLRIRLRGLVIILRQEPVATPLPHIPADLIQPKSVWLKTANRSGAQIPVLERVRHRELALPDVAQVLSGRTVKLIAPRVTFTVESASGGILPFGLGGQPPPRPPAVRFGVVP